MHAAAVLSVPEPCLCIPPVRLTVPCRNFHYAEEERGVPVNGISQVLCQLLLPPACREMQKYVAADAPLQHLIVQLLVEAALPHAEAAVAEHAVGGGSQGSRGGGDLSTWPVDEWQLLEGNVWHATGGILSLLACPCLAEGMRQVMLQPSGSGGSGSEECSPALLQALELTALAVQHLPAARPEGVSAATWGQLHAGTLSAMGTLCSLLASQHEQQPGAAGGEPGAAPSRHQQAMAVVAAAVPSLAASLRQAAACRAAEATGGAVNPLEPAVLLRPLSQVRFHEVPAEHQPAAASSN